MEEVMPQQIVAVDLAKNVFEVAVADGLGTKPQHRRLSRGQFERFIGEQPPSVFVLEGCGMAHHWGRRLGAQGHEVRLLPAQYVASYRRRNKTDRADTLALLEAHRAPDIHAIRVKSAEQQAVQQLHRVREQLIRNRTAWINQARGLLREHGVTLPQGAHAARRRTPGVLEDAEQPVPDKIRQILHNLIENIQRMDDQVADIDAQLQATQREDQDAARISQLPGIGAITSTALVSAVGDLRQFISARQFPGWLGLTPKEYSSGSRRCLGGITRSGDPYVRKQLIHGARSALYRMRRRAAQQAELTPLEAWAMNTEARIGRNKATIALANKLARRAYALCRDQGTYAPFDHPAPAHAA
ncbi:IS110 family transposase [Halorhodospira halophila]|nr:IS110 family transposase [Halorhodospira halophila]